MQKVRMIAQGRYRESAFVGVFTAWHLKLVASQVEYGITTMAQWKS
ncbi:Uncharacterised protein [Streptococcus pneumoniae]|nr:Uncharacterised protein [Streptococcus pneumoniae]VQE90790.1 Uncharacterised protein [Streptococcus pneumoniae]